MAAIQWCCACITDEDGGKDVLFVEQQKKSKEQTVPRLMSRSSFSAPFR